jgi:hypothetical protein
MADTCMVAKKRGRLTANVMGRILFSGSFQCRLATSEVPTPAGLTDAEGKPGGNSDGWTFAYGEQPFDRVVRFSNPVQLRNALLDPWEDVMVNSVEVNTIRARGPAGAGLRRVPDPLVGKIVSLGDAKLDDKLGPEFGGKEAMVDLALDIGGGLFTAGPAHPPPVLKDYDPGVKHWAREYELRKPRLIESFGSQMDPARKKYWDNEQSPGRIPDGLPYSFQARGTFVGKLTNVRCSPASVFDPTKWSDLPLTWTLDVTFFRFDGDTLTGRVAGQLYAAAKSY